VPDARGGEVTALLLDWSAGNRAALDRLVPLVYAELRRLAAAQLRGERRGDSLQATGLVHEAYVRLVDYRQARPRDRAHFLALAAQAMRRVLVDRARRRGSAKRGGAVLALPLDEVPEIGAMPAARLVALDDALQRLAALDERQERVVVLRYFGGLTSEETAEALGVSVATVERDWTSARLWLRRELARSVP
jgi:RNA polymerase sigma factor (TIGR02999 family)